MDEKSDYTFYKAVGCLSCRHAGYTGRIGVFELLVTTPGIEELVLANASGQEIKKAAGKEGMISLRQDGANKVVQGITSFEEVVTSISGGVSQRA